MAAENLWPGSRPINPSRRAAAAIAFLQRFGIDQKTEPRWYAS